MPVKPKKRIRKPKSISADCSTMSMVSGNERRFSTVIHDGLVKDWVGIGWVTKRVATKTDERTIPLVVG